MNKIYFALSVLVLILAIACEQESEECDCIEVNSEQLVGRWNMISYACECLPFPEIIPGEIVWTFAESKSQVIVENNSSSTFNYGSEVGSYTCEILPDKIIINYSDFSFEYNYHFEGDKLFISDVGAEVDAGGYMEFVRDAE